MEHPSVCCLAFSGGEAFAGVVSHGIWRRPIAEMGVTALGNRARKAAVRQRGAQAFLDGGGIGFANGGPEAMSVRCDARGRKSRLFR
jgi:hypothetical protein